MYRATHSVNPDKLKPLLKTTSLPGNYKVFDKDLKSIPLSPSLRDRIAQPKRPPPVA